MTSKKKVSQQIEKNIKNDLGIPIAFLIIDKNRMN